MRLPPRLPLVIKVAFSLIWIASAVLTFADPEASRETHAELEFPEYLVYPLAIAKLAGLVPIWSKRSHTLANFAMAGYLYDLVLALSGHIRRGDPDTALAATALLIWAAQFAVMHQERDGPST